MDIPPIERSGEDSLSLERRRNRDDIGAVGEVVGLSEEFELAHHGLELGLHPGLVVCTVVYAYEYVFKVRLYGGEGSECECDCDCDCGYALIMACHKQAVRGSKYGGISRQTRSDQRKQEWEETSTRTYRERAQSPTEDASLQGWATRLHQPESRYWGSGRAGISYEVLPGL